MRMYNSGREFSVPPLLPNLAPSITRRRSRLPCLSVAFAYSTFVDTRCNTCPRCFGAWRSIRSLISPPHIAGSVARNLDSIPNSARQFSGTFRFSMDTLGWRSPTRALTPKASGAFSIPAGGLLFAKGNSTQSFVQPAIFALLSGSLFSPASFRVQPFCSAPTLIPWSRATPAAGRRRDGVGRGPRHLRTRLLTPDRGER